MSLIEATWTLYRDSAADAFKGLGRSVWAVVALLLAYVVLAVAGMIGGRLGIVGGFLVGFVQAGVIGWYLSLVAIGVIGRRRVQLSDLREHIGSLFIEVISVLFVFFIASLLLRSTSPQLALIATILATLLFNPIPEMVYQERADGGLALLGESLRFMQHNWPEWLGAMVIGAGFLAGWGVVVFGAVGLTLALTLVQAFGPFFGFITVGSYALTGLDPLHFGGALVLLAFTHWFLLFRGHLYRRLSGSSRRARAWRSRMS